MQSEFVPSVADILAALDLGKIKIVDITQVGRLIRNRFKPEESLDKECNIWNRIQAV